MDRPARAVGNDDDASQQRFPSDDGVALGQRVTLRDDSSDVTREHAVHDELGAAQVRDECAGSHTSPLDPGQAEAVASADERGHAVARFANPGVAVTREHLEDKRRCDVRRCHSHDACRLS